jgi:type IV secretion system protein VirB5
MRPFLLATVAASAVALALAPRPAHALFGEGDLVICPSCEQEFDAAARQAQTLVQWGKQLGDMERQYQQLQSTYYALAHVTDLGGAVSALGLLGIRNPLPVNPTAVQQLMNGTGGLGGMSSSIGNLLVGVSNENRVFSPTGTGWMAQEINRNGGSIAGAQALALQLYQASADRMSSLDSLRARISSASDPSTREALIAQLTAEGNAIQNQQAQAQILGNYMQATLANQQQRVTERRQQEIADVLAEAKANGWAQ